MKAMILAAGLGSRLGDLTKEVPKPLLPVGGIPLMQILLQQLHAYGFTDIIANTYYKAELIDRFRHHHNMHSSSKLTVMKETKLSGSAGALKKCCRFFENEKNFLVVSGDILTQIDFNDFMRRHCSYGHVATMCVKEIDKQLATKFGVVHFDNQGFVTDLLEKPSIERLNSIKTDTVYINTGIYAFSKYVFRYLDELDDVIDFAKDVLPRMLRALKVYTTDSYWNDIGSIENYAQAQIDYQKLF